MRILYHAFITQLTRRSMLFTLPSTIANQLAVYDPKQRQLIELKNNQDNFNCSSESPARYHLGFVPGLIPESIVSNEDQIRAINHIHLQPSKNRFYVFTSSPIANARQLELNQQDLEGLKVKAILYYLKSRWVAAWFPLEDTNAPYVYGIAMAHRDTAKTREALTYLNVPNNGYNLNHPNTINSVIMHNRTRIVVETLHVTEQMIKAGWNQTTYELPQVKRHYSRSQKHYPYCISHFERQLLSRIPHWKYAQNPFERLSSSPESLFLEVFSRTLPNTISHDLKKLHDQEKLTLCTDEFVNALKQASLGLPQYAAAATIFSLRCMRRYIQEEINQFLNIYFDPTKTCSKECIKPVRRLGHLFNHVLCICKTWPDIPQDYFREYLETLKHVTNPLALTLSWTETQEWLRTYMPVRSYFLILKKAVEVRKESNKQEDYFLTDENGVSVIRVRSLSDTFHMIKAILEVNETLTPPKRWRIHDFHDHVQERSWLVKNENIDLPQDLFPHPIKVTLNNNNWTFIQPRNTHQLAQWGRAVRNCVGSSSSYANSVKKKQSLIVLGMLDSQPLFTVECSIKESNLVVNQIKAIQNRSLTEEQNTAYAQAFQMALQTRHLELLQAA